MPVPDLLDALTPSSGNTQSGSMPDYSQIDPDVIRTIAGEGDPASVASVMYNRKQKSGLDYSFLINDPEQFSAKTGSAWAANSKLAESDPRYQKTLAVAGPILAGDRKPVTTADSFYQPNAIAPPHWDDGTGVKGPDGQLYFNNKYALPTVPNLLDAVGETKLPPVNIPPKAADTPEALRQDLANDAATNPQWPVHDPYNNVFRNQDGSIAAIPNAVTTRLTGEETVPQGALGRDWNTNSADIAGWLKNHPNDLASQSTKAEPSSPAVVQSTGGQALEGLGQGLSNVRNSIEGIAAPVSQGVRNDLVQGLLNRQTNDTQYGNSLGYNLGKFGGEALATAPILAIPGAGELAEGALAGSRFAPAAEFLGGITASSGVARAASLAAKGALQGGEAGALTSAGSNQSLGQQVAQGAAIGGVAAPVLAGIGQKISDAISPTVSDSIRGLANKALDYGIELRVPQIKGAASASDAAPNDALKAAALDNLLLKRGIYTQNNNAQQHQFANAIGGTLDLTSRDMPNGLTQDSVDTALQRAGARMNSFASQNNIQGDGLANLHANLNDIVGQVRSGQVLPEDADKLVGIVNDIKKLGNGNYRGDNSGGFSGDSYKATVGKGSDLYALQKRGGYPGLFAGKIKDALDDAFASNYDSAALGGKEEAEAALADFQDARFTYKKALAVQNALPGFSIDGTIDPGELSKSVASRFGKGGGGDLGDLANIGNVFLKPTPQVQKFGPLNKFGLSSLGLGEGLLYLHSPADALQGLGVATAAMGANALKNRIVGTLGNTLSLRNRLLQNPDTLAPNPAADYFANKFSTPLSAIASQNAFAKQGNQ